MGPGGHDHGRGKGGKLVGGKGKGTGGGCGAGVRIRPVAVIVVGPQGVQTLPIDKKKGKLEKLIDRIPEVVSKVEKARGASA